MPVPAFRPEVQHGAWSSWSLFLGHWLAPFAGLLLASHKEGVFSSFVRLVLYVPFHVRMELGTVH